MAIYYNETTPELANENLQTIQNAARVTESELAALNAIVSNIQDQLDALTSSISDLDGRVTTLEEA